MEKALSRSHRSHPLKPLSVQEAAVCEALAEGRSNPEIAFRLNLSPHTVREYLRRAQGKYGGIDRFTLRVIFAEIHRHRTRLRRVAARGYKTIPHPNVKMGNDEFHKIHSGKEKGREETPRGTGRGGRIARGAI